MPASIEADGPRFFPNVLLDRDFQRQGVLFRTEGRLSWAVIDPRRHVMNIWQKDRPDFVDAAKARNASVISNAPFLLYTGGSKSWAVTQYGFWTVAESLKMAVAYGGWFAAIPDEGLLEHMERNHRDLCEELFSGKEVEGFIFGDREGIVEDKNPRPRASYFGRRGRLFPDYVVAVGDPPRMPEVIGGLFLSVQNYVAVDAGDTAQLGTWGLAPLALAPEPQGTALRTAGLTAAMEEYERALRDPTDEEIVPLAPGIAPGGPLPGLLIAVFGGGGPAEYAAKLANVLVKDAVRVDGNDSILLGYGGTMVQGDGMGTPKRFYNKYGYQFRAG